MSFTLSVMTASISSSSRVSPSLQTAAERKGTCKTVVKTAKQEIEMMRTNTKTKMKIKIKMEKRERLTGWLLITQVNEQTPSVLQLNDDDD